MLDMEILNIVAILVSLSALLIVFRRLNSLEKKSKSKEIDKRLRLLEEELEEYILRSQKRLTVFKRVIDGVDGVIQNIKLAMDDEKLDATIEDEIPKEAISSLEEDEEAEVIHIDE